MRDHSFASALHLLVALAYRYPEGMSSQQLALTMRTNPGLVRRLLSKLAKAGIVDTSRGAAGGSVLSRSPEYISVLEVRKALGEPPVFVGFEKKPFKECAVSCQISEILNGTFGRFEAALSREMGKLKLSELVSQVK